MLDIATTSNLLLGPHWPGNSIGAVGPPQMGSGHPTSPGGSPFLLLCVRGKASWKMPHPCKFLKTVPTAALQVHVPGLM
jgi:hypothetical protein